ncbi:hypothetical protein ET33_13680 [Paenibacillus tyrfis]|uniref:Uncharacterized protein n=1 Tax=Paenibacillus tyrfis TaxID=1501230 RepID=A0A081PAK5_9BACL|nr:hypothetical protein ET33_13680 [Paenibacillus tyrfis]
MIFSLSMDPWGSCNGMTKLYDGIKLRFMAVKACVWIFGRLVAMLERSDPFQAQFAAKPIRSGQRWMR